MTPSPPWILKQNPDVKQIINLEWPNLDKIIFCGITMGGGIKIKPVVYDIMEFENRQLYYSINNTPQEMRM